MIRRLLWAVCAVLSLQGQDLSKLPGWAFAAAKASVALAPPAEADAWVLLQRWEIVYKGDNEIRMKNYRLVRILTERGLSEARYEISSFGGKASKVKRLKGWNLRPDGQVTKLDSDLTLTVENENERKTMNLLPRVMKGSLLAFETEEVHYSPQGPIEDLSVFEENPVLSWEVEVTVPPPAQVRLAARHFQPWLLPLPADPGTRVYLENLPAWPKAELGMPRPFDVEPAVLVTILDPELTGPPSDASWDTLAKWHAASFGKRTEPSHVVAVAAPGSLEALQAVRSWIAREIVYKDIYLSPERGWVPESGPEIVRKRYGDCKDYACLFLSEAKGVGFQGFPVLARIHEGHPDAGSPPFEYTFNHVISAIRLDKSLGLPAEFETPRGRFLIVDPTDRFTPLGWLGTLHAGHQVMICTDEGAAWVTIPASAIQPSELSLDFDGAVDSLGSLTAKVRIQETGNAAELRWILKMDGTEQLLERLRGRLFQLPANATLELLGCGDPLDLTHPLWIEARLHHPTGFQFVAGEGGLLPLGLPDPPPVLQRGSAPRRFPIERRRTWALAYHVNLDLPWSLTPVLTARTGETAFRTFQFDAKAEPKGAGTHLDLRLKEEPKPAYFGYDALAQGAAAWKKDRAAVLSLREDGFAFKMAGH